MSTKQPCLLVPVKLDACVINQSLCGAWPNSTLAPISQPNFTFLRTDSSLISPDVLPLHDMHNASPASVNPRVYDLADSKPRPERRGVILHWSLPRAYRSGSASNDTSNGNDMRAPKFQTVPDRWLVIRRIHQDPNSFKPADVFTSQKLKPFTAWVIESNRLRNIQDMDNSVDIELECAPFIQGNANDKSVDGQAEIFIGNKVELEKWTEESTTKPQEFVDLTVVGAANPLFADYALHNINVFSTFDNFGTQLSEGIVSYYVIGWHSSIKQDPSGSSDGSSSFSSILKDLKMELKTSTEKELNVNVTDYTNPRILCHGSMHTVQYNSDALSNVSIPANDAGQKLGDPLSHPVTVGSTPLDSMLAYIRAHNQSIKAKTDVTADEKELAKTETDILLLDTLLIKQADDVDSQQEAADMLSANNFQPAQDSGYHWHFSAAGATIDGTSTTARTARLFVPSDKQVADLASLNTAQSALDAVTRELQAERWNLFSKWWQYIADPALKDISRKTDILRNTKSQADVVQNLLNVRDRLVKLVSMSLVPFGSDENSRIVQRGSDTRFFTQKDPTIVVPGLSNPWPNDWLENLQARMSAQLLPQEIPSTLPSDWAGLQDLFKSQITSHFPKDIQDGVHTLFAEFFTLSQPANIVGTPKVGVPPLYHDHVSSNTIIEGLDKDGKGRDQWNNSQPWFPLFLEWEIRYYHIDFHSWKFMQVNSNPDSGKPSHWRYGISESIQDLADDTKTPHVDQRTITGRVLILPQPGFTLRTNIEQLLTSTPRSDLPEDLKYDPTKDTETSVSPADKEKAIRAAFLSKVGQLQYLSAPLSGFQDHLVTRLNGTHLKPSYRTKGKQIVPFQAAVEATRDGAGFDGPQITLMDLETDKVPFSNHVPFTDGKIAPFKPATHGQFKFTRLDIFDKFGQAISAINPAPTNQIPPLYPVLSEYFHPQHLELTTQAKTVGKDPYDWCQFAQYPPTINQDARINAAFMQWDKSIGSTGLWRPCTEWENPVWGYLIVNYAEYALQVFLPDGQFYREIRMGGPTGTTETPSWAPFEQPDKSMTDIYDDSTGKLIHLNKLLEQFKKPAYLQSFIQMVNSSLGSIAHTPDSYAEYLTSIVGRPLALANVGYSLELAQPPFKNQSTVPGTADEPLHLLDYDFHVKMGDKDRVYDGLVGFFKANDDFERFGDELNLDTVYTYYPSGTKPTQAIQPNIDLLAKPYYLSSRDTSLKISGVNGSSADTAANTAAQELKNAHHRQMKLAGVIFDPFSKLHIFSGILPITSLQLPPWSLQSALQSMTAFFSMGPLLIPTPDLQNQFDWTRNLTRDTNLAALKEVEVLDLPPDPTKPAPPPRFKGIPMPAIKSAEWNWLQPFYRAPPPATDETAAGGSDQTKPVKETHWNPFVLAHLDNKPKFEQGPYTAIEGYLQLKKPIMQDVGTGGS